MKQFIETLKVIPYAVILVFEAYLHSFLCDLKESAYRYVFGYDDD